MVKGHTMSLQTRRNELKDLIAYGEENGFNKDLLADYESQLDKIIEELDEIKAERKRFKLRGVKNGNF